MYEKTHYYSLCFLKTTGMGVSYHTAYNNFKTKKVTIKRIEKTKELAKIPENATMISCSYLGCMTFNEFMKGE